MKTAVSIPDEVFAEAERLARRMKRSRSDVYSQALAECVARHAPDRVTKAVDRAPADINEPPDQFIRAASRRVLRRNRWFASQKVIIWWADRSAPEGSKPGFRCPVVVVQGDAFNRSRIATVVVRAAH